MLLGRMQDVPLVISSLIEYAADNHPGREVVSKLPDGSIHRYGYKDAERRSRQLAQALMDFGIGLSDRVASVASNSYRHFECFYGISGIGAVFHTINPRLFDTQIVYIANHAEDRILIVDPPYLGLIEKLAPELKSVEQYVILCDAKDMPETTLKNAVSYEVFIDCAPLSAWPSFDERAASSLCYTSGTTGNPKGVLYSHRSTILHALHAAQPSVLGISPMEALFVMAPMYHANAWSTPYLAPMTGAKLILPGTDTTPKGLHQFITQEQATFACAVPTVWTNLLQHVDALGGNLNKLTRAAIAGVTVPPAMIEHLRERYGVKVLQFWGMTEMSPIATISSPVPSLDELDDAARLDVLTKQGRIAYGVKLKIVDANEKAVPRDGQSVGEIRGKGPWIADGYFKNEGGRALDAEGWLPSGDVGFMDRFGYLKLTDRSKDVIKSGGEWISSVDLENAAVSHSTVREAAVVGVYHPKWDERPVMLVTLRPGAAFDKEGLITHLRSRVAKWWIPEDVLVIDEMPYTATGKIRKNILRETYRFHLFQEPASGKQASSPAMQ